MVGWCGTESDLLSCSHNGHGVHNCDHSEDASVRCEGTFIINWSAYVSLSKLTTRYHLCDYGISACYNH